MLDIDFEQDNLIQNVKSSLENYFKKSEEINKSLTKKSFIDNSIDSLKELQIENEGNRKIDNKDESDNFMINNNIKINILIRIKYHHQN